MKRCIDFCMALALICLFSPLLLVIMLLIRCKMGKPIFFCQRRPGLNNRSFLLIKFRTMQNAPAAEENTADFQRITPLGALLRKTSLDELPQLFNVLKGDMSFVGPRPLLMEYLPLYNAEQARRHTVQPGITGWAQVNGRNAISWEEKFKLDVWYVDHASFALDMKILWLTLRRVIQAQGVNQDKDVTMDKFRGPKS